MRGYKVVGSELLYVYQEDGKWTFTANDKNSLSCAFNVDHQSDFDNFLGYFEIGDELKKIGCSEGNYFLYVEMDVIWNYTSNSNGSDWDVDFEVTDMRLYKVKDDKYD